jgi:uncharacterized membrane protein
VSAQGAHQRETGSPASIAAPVIVMGAGIGGFIDGILAHQIFQLAGWGLFNLVEGTINHHLLQLHRVNPEATHPLAWDVGFLVLGAILLVGGSFLARRDTPREPP